MKSSTIASIVGAVLVLAGIGGGAFAVLGGQEDKEPKLTAAEIAEKKRLEVEEARKAEQEEAERLARNQAKQDDADIRQIVEDKVAETPAQIDDGWFADLFVYISNRDSLLAYRQELLERGAQYDVQYSAEFAAKGDGRKVQSNDPRFYINTKAGEIIHAASPPERKLRNQAKGYLALGVYREYLQKEEVWEAMRPEIMTTYFQKSVKRLEMLIEIEKKKGRRCTCNKSS